MTIAGAAVPIDFLVGRAHAARQKTRVKELLAAIPTLPLDEAAANRAAETRRALEKAGEPIGMADSLIAGIVLVRSATLLTRNRRHFERVDGLPLADLHRRV